MLFRDVVTDVSLGRQNRSVLAFYIKRLGRENLKRGLLFGLVMTVLSLQIVTMVLPPRLAPESRVSSNDVLHGGFRDKTHITHELEGENETSRLYRRLGIRVEAIAAAEMRVEDVGSTGWMVGRNPHGVANQNVSLTMNDSEAYYMYPVSQQAFAEKQSILVGRTTAGHDFTILMNSGNPIIKVHAGPDQLLQAFSTDGKTGQATSNTAPQLTYLVSAVNLSQLDKNQQPVNAAGIAARAGQEIRYTLAARNTGQSEYRDFVFESNLNDILEYADLEDLGGAELIRSNSSQRSELKLLRWPAVNIDGQRIVSRSFSVKVKQPVSPLPIGLTDSASYDTRMESYFGYNRSVVQVESPFSKRIEAWQSSLPDYVSWVSLMALILLTLGQALMWYRVRLMRRELAIMATTGGHPK